MSHIKNNEVEKIYLFTRWMTWLFMVSSVLFLIYIYYRSEITYLGQRNEIYLKYYLISLTGILFWGVVLRLRNEIRANIVTFITSMLVGLYLIEGGLILSGHDQPSVLPSAVKAAAAKQGIEYDDRSKFKVIESLIAEGVDAVPAVRPIDVMTMDKDLFPLGGVSSKTTVANNENGYFMIYPSDRYGFNNPDSEWDAKSVDWFLTGDSYTEGLAVHPGQDIAGQIRLITKQPTISVGRSGNGPLMEFALLREYAESVKPKRVFWVYFEGNDLRSDLKRDKNNLILMKYMKAGFSQNLISRQKEIDISLLKHIISVQAQAQAESKTEWIKLQAIRSLINFDSVDNIGEVEVDDPLFIKILTKTKERVETWGGEFYFVYLPEYSRYKNKVVSHDGFRRKSEVIEVVKEIGIPVIDIHQMVFAKYDDPLSLFPFRLPRHYNAEGYSEVARAIVEGVKKYEDLIK